MHSIPQERSKKFSSFLIEISLGPGIFLHLTPITIFVSSGMGWRTSLFLMSHSLGSWGLWDGVWSLLLAILLNMYCHQVRIRTKYRMEGLFIRSFCWKTCLIWFESAWHAVTCMEQGNCASALLIGVICPEFLHIGNPAYSPSHCIPGIFLENMLLFWLFFWFSLLGHL